MRFSGKLYVRTRSERSTVRTWLRRSALALASASASACASSRARSTRIACSLFCSWLFSFWQDTTIPLGRWVIRTAESVVFTLCPPGPEDLNTVHAALVLQPGPGALGTLALHCDRHVLDPAQAGARRVEDLGPPAAPLGVTQVHPEQVAREQRGFLAALACLDLKNDVAPVIRIPGHQQPLQLSLELLPVCGQLLALSGERGVFPGQLPRRLLVRRGLLPLLVSVHDGGQLGVAAAKRARSLLVRVHGGVGEGVLQLRVLANQFA